MEFLNGVPIGFLLGRGNGDLELGEVAWHIWVCADSDAGDDAECTAATAAESPKEIFILDVVCDDMFALGTVSEWYFGIVSVDVPWH